MPLEMAAVYDNATIFWYAHPQNIRLLPNPITGYDRDTNTQIAAIIFAKEALTWFTKWR